METDENTGKYCIFQAFQFTQFLKEQKQQMPVLLFPAAHSSVLVKN